MSVNLRGCDRQIQNKHNRTYGWSETGFLREYFITVAETHKNPVSWILMRKSYTLYIEIRLEILEVDKHGEVHQVIRRVCWQ